MRDAFRRSAVLPRRRWHSRVFAAGLRGLSLMVASLAGQAASAQSEPVPADSWARRQEIAQLGEITPNVAADFDPVLGTPTFIRSTTAFLTRRSGRTPAQIVADFVNDNPATFGVSLSGGNLAGAEQFTPATYRTIRDFETPSLGPTGVRHLTYQQTHNGQDIYGSLLTANITGDGMLVNIGSRFVPEPGTPITAPACDEANRTVRDVVAAACDEVGDTRIADIVNQDDVAYLVGVVGGGENPSGVDPDFNRDGNIDQDDVAALIGYVSGAGCP